MLLENVTVNCTSTSSEAKDNEINSQDKITCNLYDTNKNNKSIFDSQGKKLYSIYIDTGNGKLQTKWIVDYGNQRYFKISFTFIILLAILVI